MPTAPHNELVSILARIDQLIAEVESHVRQPDDEGEVQSALDLLAEFRRARDAVERKLRVSDG